jgi:large subunit ribosomal protein L6
MSRIGLKPLNLPEGVNVNYNNKKVEVKGPKGELSFTHREEVKLEITDQEIKVLRIDDEKKSRAFHGLTRTLIANMVKGVKDGFEKRIEIHGVGYRAQVNGDKFVLTLGFSHPVEVKIPETLKVEQDKNNKNEFIISGCDKQEVGQFAANIRAYRKPEPYKGKGIRYKGEYVRRKAGKTAKK